jgi:RNA polymerase I-specific transcription initiation factor RRN3
MEEIHLMLNALSHAVSHLDRKHASLVNAIISLQWASSEMSFVKSYISFIGLLLSAQTEYGVAVLEKAVDGLTYRKHNLGLYPSALRRFNKS